MSRISTNQPRRSSEWKKARCRHHPVLPVINVLLRRFWAKNIRRRKQRKWLMVSPWRIKLASPPIHLSRWRMETSLNRRNTWCSRRVNACDTISVVFPYSVVHLSTRIWAVSASSLVLHVVMIIKHWERIYFTYFWPKEHWQNSSFLNLRTNDAVLVQNKCDTAAMEQFRDWSTCRTARITTTMATGKICRSNHWDAFGRHPSVKIVCVPCKRDDSREILADVQHTPAGSRVP